VTRKLRVGVAGANGYAGMTAVQLLARHPQAEICALTSRSLAGKPYSDVFPLLDLQGQFATELPEGLDAVFSCLPHNAGAAAANVWLHGGAKVIDMSADFRLHEAALYPKWYGQPHPAPELLGKAEFGLPELHEAGIRKAQLIAAPGCYSTASILALAPAVAGGLAGADIVVDAKSGVSGAGRSAGLGTHFGEVDESVHAYAIEGHRHVAEIEQELNALHRDGNALRITFVPHLIPMVRGILATCYFELKGSVEALRDAYRDFYSRQPFTRVVDKTPATKLTSHSNLCLINVSAQGGKAVVTAALDNLVKGASGQGVECFNIAFGLDRTAGLQGAVQWP
jgi:N-acetyl-gamma-glutamyl-phosphate reductase